MSSLKSLCRSGRACRRAHYSQGQGALSRADLRPSLTSAAHADRRATDRDGGMTGPNRTTEWETYQGSGWHGDSQIKPFACLQHAEAKDQEFAHGRHHDLLGFETTRAL